MKAEMYDGHMITLARNSLRGALLAAMFTLGGLVYGLSGAPEGLLNAIEAASLLGIFLLLIVAIEELGMIRRSLEKRSNDR